MEAAFENLWANYLVIVSSWAIMVISPGPNLIATVHASAAKSRRAGLAVATGISVGTAIWTGVSLAGLSIVLQTFGWAYFMLKLGGACYLIWLGIRLICSRGADGVEGGPQGLVKGGLWSSFRLGLLTDLANPKAAIFFVSLFAITVPVDAPAWFQLLAAASVVAIAGFWYAIVACAMGHGSVSNAYRRYQNALNRLAGGIMIALGVRLAAER